MTAPPMNLVHFSVAAEIQVESREQGKPTFKPNGFWVSDESDETCWSSWCASEEYTRGPIAHRVTLAPDALVLTLTTVEAVRHFHRDFASPLDRYYLDWAAVADNWQGIIISPYQWPLRLDREVNWYYPWDCASGCIWDAAAIASVTRLAEVPS